MMAFGRSLKCALGALALTATLAAPLALPAVAQQAGPNTVEAIRARGHLACGVNTGLAGFAQPDSQGQWKGFDIDYCRAVAAAVLGDPSKVRYTPLTAQQRFTALQSGEIDVLFRNTTWTFSRDTSLGLDFPIVNFYDGQGFMVKANSGVKSANELNGATICVQPGTTTEQNLTDWARANNIRFTPVVIERLEEVVGAYVAGRCDAYTTDASGLAATRSAQPNPADHVILPEVISKEPLGPAVRQGDPRFADIVRWTHYGLLVAEELGITQANLAQHLASDTRPEALRLLGKTGELGKMLGLSDDWMLHVLRAGGNYGEVFHRHLAPIGLQRARSPNALYTHGGLQYAPPFR